MRAAVVIINLACATLLLFSPQPANACSCLGSEPPCQAYGAAAAVFSGRVTDIIPIVDKNNPHRGHSQRLVRFAVDESYRGLSGTLAETITGTGEGDCGYRFQVGESYLVYAYLNSENNKLYAGTCSRTRLLSEAREDLEYIQGLSNAEAGGTVYGLVNKFRRVKGEYGDVSQPLGPLVGVHITVEGSGRSVVSITNRKGEFRVTGLPAGSYEVRLKVPEDLWPNFSESKVELKDKGCALVNFDLERNTSLSGKVVEESGGPAAKIMVNLVPSNQINARYQPDGLFIESDDDGRFEFRSIPPGEYFLGVRLSRLTQPEFAYPRTFYPGTQELAETQPITISEGQNLTGYNIQLPQKLAPRSISGIVVWPDGKPAPNASLCLEEVEYAEESACYGGDGKVTDEGRFTFSAFEGLRYLLRAHVNVGKEAGQRHAEPIEIPAKGSITDIKLVLTEPNGSCEKCRGWKRKRSQ